MRRRTAAVTTALLLTVAVAPPACAQSLTFGVDVPTALGGVDYTTNQAVAFDRWTYGVSAAATFPAGFPVGALQKTGAATYYVVAAEPVNAGGFFAAPCDILTWDGTAFAMWQAGGDIGLTDADRIDALFVGADALPVVSFQGAATLGGTTIGRSDIAQYDGSWHVLLSASAAGIPDYANVVGVDRTPSGDLALAFDVPTTIGGTTYMPGDVARWTGSGFALYTRVPGWPLSSTLADFTFAPTPPTVAASPGLLTVAKSGADVRLSWSTYCGTGAEDFAVYEGPMDGVFDAHAPRTCSTGGAITTTLTPGAGNRYFLVSAIAGGHEGSLGHRTNGSEIPAGPAACLAKAIGACPGAP